MTLDRRRSTRSRSLLSGLLVFDDCSRSLSCTIRNLTDVGARVELGGVILLPPSLWMIETRNGIAHEAKVAWRLGNEFGLKFLSQHRLDDATTPELKTLRRLWVDQVPRGG